MSMRWLALAVLFPLAACGNQSVPDALDLEVGDVIAQSARLGGGSFSCDDDSWVISEISGDLVRINDTDNWINLGARSHIRICKRKGG